MSPNTIDTPIYTHTSTYTTYNHRYIFRYIINISPYTSPVTGLMSPNPVVVIVTIDSQAECGIDCKGVTSVFLAQPGSAS